MYKCYIYIHIYTLYCFLCQPIKHRSKRVNRRTYGYPRYTNTRVLHTVCRCLQGFEKAAFCLAWGESRICIRTSAWKLITPMRHERRHAWKVAWVKRFWFWNMKSWKIMEARFKDVQGSLRLLGGFLWGAVSCVNTMVKECSIPGICWIDLAPLKTSLTIGIEQEWIVGHGLQGLADAPISCTSNQVRMTWRFAVRAWQVYGLGEPYFRWS